MHAVNFKSFQISNRTWIACQLQSQDSTSFKTVMNRIRLQSFQQDSSVNLKFAQFPCFLRKLNLSFCKLGDEDFPSSICELVNLQVLDLRGNYFSRLHFSLSRTPNLKVLNLSCCESHVELPDLPSSIAILKANICSSLESLGYISNYKWLWKVSLWNSNKLPRRERVLHSMLQGNAVENRFMSLTLPGRQPEMFCNTTTFITLQLPPNWNSEFTGFLVSAENYLWKDECVIVIKQEMSMDPQTDHHHDEFDINLDSYEYAQIGYVPFGSLRHTPWWNSAHTNISFEIQGKRNCKVERVPRRSNSGDSRERANDTLDCSECLEEEYEYRNTFKIINDPIRWRL
ncbi:putative leucine-rich repeat domain superfamily [Helianthus annuus]|nr:putative leucine-rich repeat domain superfamily [Helianthus annuus]KAJ0629904.1 putative leucine-rich repeat domain superfamily [Helianthus annuus]KAJ0629906.1 putative leucine-rich repeat domain superfamily [Helianthus annuus]KAJ0720980.1 putative leucine-rich repeat domain superfamily [Helianthus annuus]